MRINKTGLFFAVMSSLLFFANSTGFDFYSHAVSYYFYKEAINSSHLLFGNIVLPRYLFLSVVYEYVSFVGLPLGWIVLFLIFFPVYKTFSSEEFSAQKTYTGYKILVIIVVVISSFFYSGLSVTLLWLVAFHYCNKNIFLIGGLFHPVGFILFSIYLFFFNRVSLIRFSFFVLVPFLFFLYMVSKFHLMSSISYIDFKFYINSETIFDLLIFSFEKKRNEFLQLFLIGIVLTFVVYVRTSSIIRVLMFPLLIVLFSRINSRIFKFNYILFVSIIILYMSSKPGLFQYLFYNDSNPVYVAWFDFGSKDLLYLGWSNLYCQRFSEGGCW